MKLRDCDLKINQSFLINNHVYRARKFQHSFMRKIFIFRYNYFFYIKYDSYTQRRRLELELNEGLQSGINNCGLAFTFKIEMHIKFPLHTNPKICTLVSVWLRLNWSTDKDFPKRSATTTGNWPENLFQFHP